MTDDAAWRAAVENSQAAARERSSFSAIRALLTRHMEAGKNHESNG